MCPLVSVYSHRDFLDNEPHMLHFALMLGSGGNDIDARGVDACVSENICELGNILFDAVKGTSEQMTEIVREHLAR